MLLSARWTVAPKALTASLVLALFAPTSVDALTIFEADFESSTPNISDPLAPDADEANANAGTSVGTWDFTNSGGAAGAVFANGGGTNNALAIDTTLSGNTSAIDLLFSAPVDLTTNNIIVDFDMRATRSGSGRQVRFNFSDDTNSFAYQYVYLHAGQDQFGFRNDSDATSFLASTNDNAEGDQPVNPGVGAAPDDIVGVRLEISPGASADGLAKLSVDWNNDGDFDDDDGDGDITTGFTEANGAPIEARTLGIDEITKLRLSFNGCGSGCGVWLDNILVTSEFDLPPVPGDVDGDGIVEGVTLNPDGTIADDGFGNLLLGDDLQPIVDNFFSAVSTREEGDLVGPFGIVDFADFREWKNNSPTPLSAAQVAAIFGGSVSVPEPSAGVLMIGFCFALAGKRRAVRTRV